MLTMMMHIHSPDKIKRFVDYNYVSSKDLIDIREMFPIIPFYNYFKGIKNIEINRLVYFEYDIIRGMWNIYRNTPDPKFIIDSEQHISFLSNEFNYMCYITEESFDILFTISIIDSSVTVLTNNFINHNGLLNDAGYITADGRILLLNSTNPIDMIFSYTRFGYDRDMLSQLLNVMSTDDYYINIETGLKNLAFAAINVRETQTINNYTNLFKISMSHDINYHVVKYDTFHANVIKILNELSNNVQEYMFRNLFSFFRNLRNDMVIELNQLYHRFRNYPHERVAIFTKYPDHPMIKLLKYIHTQSIELTQFVNYEFISYLINADASVMIHDYIGSLLQQAFAYRSDLFVDVYYQFYQTEKSVIIPKYNNLSRFYPFRRYSSSLFVLEHLLKLYI